MSLTQLNRLPVTERMTEPSSSAAKSASLFERLGGRERLLFLLKHFYADVRQHSLIGPLFLAHIQDWPAHLEKIGDFWSGAIGGPARYQGPMPAKHVPLGLTESHFEAWLGLWERHCQAHLAPAEASELVAIAHAIGQRLREIIGLRNYGAAT
jgi:hemoglobin